jgi:hypothetical protein
MLLLLVFLFFSLLYKSRSILLQTLHTSSILSLPSFPGSFMANNYFLFLFPFPSNCGFLCVTFSPAALPPVPFSPVASPCKRHLNLQKGLWFRHKKARKEVLYSSLLRLVE